MGQTPAATMTEIEATRRRLDGEIRQLEAMLPRPVAWGKRIVAVLLGGGLGGTILLMLVRRRRAKKGDRHLSDLDHRLRRIERRVDGLYEVI
jgi:hypothetical protein